MKGSIYGLEDELVEGHGGWAMWKSSCPTCGEKTDEDGEMLFALQCPVCEEPGCDECMPLGRGCACPNCEGG